MAIKNICFKVAAVQMNSVNDKEANLKKAEEFINLAAKEGARAEPIPGSTINRLKELAVKLNIYLLCGSILEKSEQKEKPLSSLR